MAEALKDMYTKKFLIGFATKVQGAYGTFDCEGFVATAVDATWEELKLKERMRRITETLGMYLPKRFEEAIKVLFDIDESCVGFPYLFFPDFVAVYGKHPEHFQLSMEALERFTIRSSSEFAVRPFITRDPERMICQMLKWSQSSNQHVRRLASEGCRPRLPWGEALTVFKNDPIPVLAVLENLKEDPSLYVRKSVANNLNDISKDNPLVVIEIIRKWKGVHPYTDWILRHASRTLIRMANPEVMKLFGYEESMDGCLTTSATLHIDLPEVRIGESSELKYEINIRQGEPVHIRIEYGIDFVKARGKTSRKLFLLSDKTVPGGTYLKGSRMHRWKNLTTRKHYPGEHTIVLLINGFQVANTVMKLDV